MKFAVFALLFCLSVACVSTENPPKVQTWGTITNQILGVRNVLVKSSLWQVKTAKLTFPEGPGVKIIYGIKHLDYKQHTVSVRFLSGGINDRSATLLIESQRGHGINSTFIFYTN